jgi:Amt family ammonium transporter
MLSLEQLGFTIDIIWLFLGAILVFVMQLGFMLLETGLCRAKNANNITMKNVMDFMIGALAYWAIGYAFMYGKDVASVIGLDSFFPGMMEINQANGSFYATWFFQVVFAATAATIVSGAMAERTKFSSYLIYTVFISAIIYPISGHWMWSGDGWLAKLGFHDFAGSTVVHSVGGWAALMGAIMVGPRIGKYAKDKQTGKVTVKAFPGHNIPYAALGTMLLFFGWFGFNGASTLTALGEGSIWSGENISRVLTTTCLAASAGGVSSLIFCWIRYKKPDVSMILNGILAGLVAITAPCAVVSPAASVVIGLIAGVLVVLAIDFIDKVLKIDDPVGASSVHLVNGIFGTLAVGIWANAPSDGVVGLLHGGGFGLLGVQALGVLAVGAWAAGMSFLLFFVIKKTHGLRVKPKEELQGLDICEHESEAYSGFQVFSNM